MGHLTDADPSGRKGSNFMKHLALNRVASAEPTLSGSSIEDLVTKFECLKLRMLGRRA